MSLDRDSILKLVTAPEIREVPVPELGGSVHVRAYNASQAIQLDRLNKLNPDDIHVNIVLVGACDKAGKPLFKLDDIDAVRELPASAVVTIATALIELNSLGETAESRAKK